MFELFKGKSATEQEAIFLENADEILEKSASAAEVEELLETAPESDPARLEDRVEKPEEEEEDEDLLKNPYDPSSGWGKKPTRRRQMVDYPETIRFVNPTAAILDLTDKDQLKTYNKLLSRAADREAPEIIITERETQKHDGGWTLLLEYSTVEYQQI